MKKTELVSAESVISWSEGGQNHSALWRSEAGVATPKRVHVVDDTLTADAAYRLALSLIHI